ncbi:hypothetical protein SDC9_75416 [bioreactor metagenome]|uniref:Uncharacterized protein n=1 Tax=bioreactor metagenome TaxID=1076179 RepID=A0A644YKM3_9ZZZZ
MPRAPRRGNRNFFRPAEYRRKPFREPCVLCQRRSARLIPVPEPDRQFFNRQRFKSRTALVQRQTDFSRRSKDQAMVATDCPAQMVRRINQYVLRRRQAGFGRIMLLPISVAAVNGAAGMQKRVRHAAEREKYHAQQQQIIVDSAASDHNSFPIPSSIVFYNSIRMIQIQIPPFINSFYSHTNPRPANAGNRLKSRAATAPAATSVPAPRLPERRRRKRSPQETPRET